MQKQQGFSLIEISIVLLILSLLMAGSLAGFKLINDYKLQASDQQNLAEIKASLLSYAAVYKHFPCPDTDGDGVENRAGNICSATAGNLPFAQLGIKDSNPYGQKYIYQINRLANSSQALNPNQSASYFGKCTGTCFDLATAPSAEFPTATGNLQISDGAKLIAIDLPLVVISPGRQSCQNATGFKASNCSSQQTTFYQTAINQPTGQPLDDQLIWISSLSIKSSKHRILENYLR